MVNPQGMSIRDDILFVSEGYSGLKLYDITNPEVADENLIIEYEDIPAFCTANLNDNLIVIGESGLNQYNYSNPLNIELVSTINFNLK